MAQTAPPVAGRPPVIRVTRYDQISAFLFSVIGGLCCTVFLLGFAWYATRAPKVKEPVAVELFEDAGGVEDGSPDETLRVDSPDPPSQDAAVGEAQSDQQDVQESIEQVVSMADTAVVETQRPLDLGVRNAAKPGSADGTGRRALGSGPGSKGGFPREQRWMVRFADQSNLAEYARQLDFFEIELGAVVNGKLVYLSHLSDARPTVRTANSGVDEKRLYMTWQGGGRKQADMQIFRRAGIDVGQGAMFQFYAKATEDKLARLELAYRNRTAKEIRRTYFAVDRAEGGYAFSVVHQTYLR
ncbi:MAG: hypothetical protein HY290_30975 [Planctomycetia bacterium]|nr:hypothetical protein [Planctomycetia bacterium]